MAVQSYSTMPIVATSELRSATSGGTTCPKAVDNGPSHRVADNAIHPVRAWDSTRWTNAAGKFNVTEDPSSSVCVPACINISLREL
jgi:hypothetical protein